MTSRTHQIRTQQKKARLALSHPEQKRRALLLGLRIMRHPCFKATRRFSAYLAFRGEISLSPVLKEASRRQKLWALPRIKNTSMTFHIASSTDSLQKNNWGILEPRAIAPQLPEKNIDLWLCPLVAFDNTGNRLGMGGGFYDRALKRRKKDRRLRLWGVAHCEQEVKHLQADPWGVKLQGVFTPSGVHTFF